MAGRLQFSGTVVLAMLLRPGRPHSVMLPGVDEKGRVRLSRKAAMKDRDKEHAAEAATPQG